MEYKRVKISEICSSICSGGTPKSTIPEYYGGNIPWLNTKEINFNRIYNTEKSITKEGLINSSAKWIEENSVVVAMYGATAGKSAITKIPLTTNQACCNITVNNSKADYRFVYYALYNDYKCLASLANGGAQQNLNAQLIKDFDIPNFPLNEQIKIANLISTLDDKIELNRRINDNLEQQAQTLFKSWFLDFEPFKDGNFVDSELGMIPEGWKVGTVSDVILSTISGDWGKDEQQGNYSNRVFCIRGADIPDIRKGDRGKMPTRYILAKNFESKKLDSDDIVVEISGGSPTQSTGRICHISQELIERSNDAIICTNFCRALKPKLGFSSYLYYKWDSIYNQGVLFLYENGTTGIKNLDLNGLLQNEMIVIPPLHMIERFNSYIHDISKLVQKNGIELEFLSAIRDTLLPKLMSGELKINDLNS